MLRAPQHGTAQHTVTAGLSVSQGLGAGSPAEGLQKSLAVQGVTDVAVGGFTDLVWCVFVLA